MGKVPDFEFSGSRARFQRLSDQRVFSGWLKSLDTDCATVTIEGSLPVKTSERFLFQVQGATTDAYFIATNNVVPVAKTTLISGATALKSVEVPALEYAFELITRIELRHSLQQRRKSIQAKVARLTLGGKTSEILAADASAEGMGIISWVEANPGDVVQVEVEDHKSHGSFTCEVRHCRPEPGITGAYRIGLQFTRTDRVSLANWRKLLNDS